MKTIVTILALFAILLIGPSTHAAPSAGTGGGYYGSAWYDSNQGTVVGPYATYAECNQALNAAVAYKVTQLGWSVVSFQPCYFNPPFGMVAEELSGLEGLEHFARVTAELEAAHERLSAVQYETAVCDIVDPNEDEDFDSDARAKCVSRR
jgi:hypothetical protein